MIKTMTTKDLKNIEKHLNNAQFDQSKFNRDLSISSQGFSTIQDMDKAYANQKKKQGNQYISE